jgi:hypothetical protein
MSDTDKRGRKVYIVDTPVENQLHDIQLLIKIICTFIPKNILVEVHLLEVIAVASSSKNFAQYFVQLYQVLQYSEYFSCKHDCGLGFW